MSRIDLWRLVSEAAASGAAVLMSTTYLDEAERAGHLVVLDHGRVLVQGPYDQGSTCSAAAGIEASLQPVPATIEERMLMLARRARAS